MPIGKNAIKRVENNGYSNVKTSAPDMENSNVIANPDVQVVEKLIAPVEKATAKKAPAKKSASTEKKTSTAAKKPAVKKTAPKAEPVIETPVETPVVETAVLANVSPETVAAVIGHKEDEKYEKVQIGQKMPDFLL